MSTPAPSLRPASWPLAGLLLAVTLAGCDSQAPPRGAAKSAATSEATAKAPSPPADRSPEPGASDGSAKVAGDAPPAPAGEGEAQKQDAAARKVPPGVDPLVPEGIARETTEGWWRIVFSVNGNDYSAGFLHVTKDEQGQFKVAEVRTNDIVNPATPVRSEATDTTVRVFFEHEQNKFDYAGTLADNVIRGNLQFSTPRQNLVRLIPARDEEVTEAAIDTQQLGTTFGTREIVAALQGEEPMKQLREVATTWRNSPVLFMAYDVLFTQAKKLELDEAALQQLAEEFEQVGRIWGERAEQAAKLNIAVDLMFAGHGGDFARRKLSAVRMEATELAEIWGDLLRSAERVADIDDARRQIAAGQAQQGLEALRRLRSERPTDPLATYRLAAAEQDHGSKDEALALFARLAALPQSEAELGDIPGEPDYVAPRVAAARLFEAKNGTRDGFEPYLTQVYRESVVSFLTDEHRNRPATESARTVVVELFTGAMCPPCVAADVATEAVEKSFPGSDVLVLRYHVHIPGPDPLANTDSVSRMEYYGDVVQGTPTILIDGVPVPYNVGGGYSSSPEIYELLAGSLAADSAEPPRAKIELSAEAEGETLRVSAKASDIENPSDSLRLRIVVAENGVEYTARNGIREHEMVVREMPGGAAGIAPVDGAVSFEQEIPLAELRDRLVSYLDGYEGDATQRYGQPFTFGERPLGLRRLTVVAFLQDDATREILQAAVAPIEQEFDLPPLPEKPAAETADANPEEAAAGNPEGPALSAPEE